MTLKISHRHQERVSGTGSLHGCRTSNVCPMAVIAAVNAPVHHSEGSLRCWLTTNMSAGSESASALGSREVAARATRAEPKPVLLLVLALRRKVCLQRLHQVRERIAPGVRHEARGGRHRRVTGRRLRLRQQRAFASVSRARRRRRECPRERACVWSSWAYEQAASHVSGLTKTAQTCFVVSCSNGTQVSTPVPSSTLYVLPERAWTNERSAASERPTRGTASSAVAVSGGEAGAAAAMSRGALNSSTAKPCLCARQAAAQQRGSRVAPRQALQDAQRLQAHVSCERITRWSETERLREAATGRGRGRRTCARRRFDPFVPSSRALAVISPPPPRTDAT